MHDPTCELGIGAFHYFKVITVTVFSLPTRSEEKGVLGVGSIPVAILPSCHNIKMIAL